AQSLADRLSHAGFPAQLLSGAQDQEQRLKALVQLKAFRCRILVSTDLVGEYQANFQHYERLFEAEKKAAIKVVPKLTEHHVKPQKLQTMNVRLATQLFSRSVSIGLKVYRQMMVPGFADSFGTEQFTMLLNDLFDILNSKVPAAGIRKGSPKIKVPELFYVAFLLWGKNRDLKLCTHSPIFSKHCFLFSFICFQFLDDFLAMLNETESIPNVKLFASRQTIESLRVTLMSVLSLVEFLFNQGVSYILTASLNQDPLELLSSNFFLCSDSLGS
ncbi:hypothetical protein V5799_010546, partial [Amblyomma americanum]